MHPWEIDPEQPRVNGLSSRSKFRHYVNLDRTEIKFRKLLKNIYVLVNIILRPFSSI